MLRSVHATLIAVVIVVFSALGAIEAAASQCSQSFSWLPNTETDLSGYKIYYGTADGGPYPDIVDVGNPATVDGRVYAEVSGLTCGLTYYFVSVAYNTVDEESAYSTQVSVILEGVPTIISIEVVK